MIYREGELTFCPFLVNNKGYLRFSEDGSYSDINVVQEFGPCIKDKCSCYSVRDEILEQNGKSVYHVYENCYRFPADMLQCHFTKEVPEDYEVS